MNWFRAGYDTENLSGVTFTLLEGEPTGALWETIRQVTDQDGILESLILPTDGTDEESMQSFPKPEVLADEVNRYLRSFVWVQV